jgi:hypothetical protein
MANSSHSYPIISASQASKEVTANGMDLAGSPALLWGIDLPNTSGLTLGLLEGCLNVAGTPTQIAATTVSLTGGATNYVEATTAGVVSANTSAFTGGRLRLYTVVCGASTITSHIDHRNTATFAGITGTVGSGDVVGPASSVNDRVVFFDGTTGKLIKDSGLTLSGTNTGDQTSVTGNAGTATALQTARTIGGVSFDGTANITQPYDMVVAAAGVPTASQVLLKMTMPRAVTLAANLSGSKPTAADVAATASAVVTINKNGSPAATLTYAAAGTVPTLATTSGAAQSFAVDDVMTVVCPASPDATLSGIYIVLAGTR